MELRMALESSAVVLWKDRAYDFVRLRLGIRKTKDLHSFLQWVAVYT
jgi:hypothetical protein